MVIRPSKTPTTPPSKKTSVRFEYGVVGGTVWPGTSTKTGYGHPTVANSVGSYAVPVPETTTRQQGITAWPGSRVRMDGQSASAMPSFFARWLNQSREWNLRYTSHFQNNRFTERTSGSEAGSFLRLGDFCITQL
jgi:hypothetical protein